MKSKIRLRTVWHIYRSALVPGERPDTELNYTYHLDSEGNHWRMDKLEYLERY